MPKRVTKRLATYRAWRNMLARCYNPTHVSFDHYGGRGITVWDQWNPIALAPIMPLATPREVSAAAFKCFVKYVGLRPSKEYSLDRKDPDGPYDNYNTRWATAETQASNKRNSLRIPHPSTGALVPPAEVAREQGITYQALRWKMINEGTWPDMEQSKPITLEDGDA